MKNKEPIIATASLPPEALQQGVLQWANSGGQIIMDDVSIPIGIVGVDSDGPWASVGFGTPRDWSLGSSGFTLHLGETRHFPGLGTVTLVSLSAMYETVQTVTLLIDLEPQPTPTASPS